MTKEKGTLVLYEERILFASGALSIGDDELLSLHAEIVGMIKNIPYSVAWKPWPRSLG